MTLEDALQIHSGNPKSDFKYKSLMTELYTYYKKMHDILKKVLNCIKKFNIQD